MRRSLPLIAVTLLSFAMPAARADTPATEPANLNDVVPLVPSTYRHRLVQQLSLAEDHQQVWLHAIAAAPAEQREGVAYLLVNMPEADLKALSKDYLLKDVDLAYKARAATRWAAAVPTELFLRDVLPYASLDERRDDWRPDFVARYAPLVKDCKSAADAVQLLNKKVFPDLKVKYHATKRQKPNQSPYESTKIGFASCTGLSVILVDACRAVGIPARVAGTPMWTDNSGNHTWPEVWDGQWYFVGAAEPGPLNQTWFAGNAAQADASKPEHRIYATDFDGTGNLLFPMVWNENQQDVHADDVTAYYKGRHKLTVTAAPGVAIEVRRSGKLVAASHVSPATFELGAGSTYAVSTVASDGTTAPAKTVTLPPSGDLTVTFP